MNGLGARAEAVAAAFLQARGMEIIERNWRCRFGEIDLVARHAGVLVFVEVRARTSEAFGGAIESIDRAKRRKLATAARQYLAGVDDDVACRFDAVLVSGPGKVEWIRDAFRDE